MRHSIPMVTGGLALLAFAACAPNYHIRTIVSPQAHLGTARTFRILPAPPRRDGRTPRGAYDPMVDNSITGQALRDAIGQTLTARGYAAAERNPDLAIAVYASARETIDLDAWDYGYPTRPPWWRGGPVVRRPLSVTEGTVVVDVIDPRSRELLWRGSGSARLSEDPTRDTEELSRVARAIATRFPAARTTLTASR